MSDVVFRALIEKKEALEREIREVEGIIDDNPVSDLCELYDRFNKMGREERDANVKAMALEEKGIKARIDRQSDLTGLMERQHKLNIELIDLNNEIHTRKWKNRGKS